MTFQRLAELLLHNENTLVTPSSWKDPFEGWIKKQVCIQLRKKHRDFCLTGNFFGQCWTSEQASDAMWNVYSNGKDGIRIRTRPEKLLKFAKSKLGQHCYTDQVIYKDVDDIVDSFHLNNFSTSWQTGGLSKIISELAKTYMYKRKAFSYEKEFRLICYLEESAKIKRYDICPGELIDQIRVHPLVKDEELNDLKRTLKELGFKRTKDENNKDAILQSTYLRLPKSNKFSHSPNHS